MIDINEIKQLRATDLERQINSEFPSGVHVYMNMVFKNSNEIYLVKNGIVCYAITWDSFYEYQRFQAINHMDLATKYNRIVCVSQAKLPFMDMWTEVFHFKTFQDIFEYLWNK